MQRSMASNSKEIDADFSKKPLSGDIPENESLAPSTSSPFMTTTNQDQHNLTNEAHEEQVSRQPPHSIHPELEKLRIDVRKLETAIRETDKAIKDLNDWFLDQLSITNDRMGDNEVSASRESEVRRIYEEKSKAMKRKQKTLQGNLDAVTYIIDHLERHSIPSNASPTSYIRRLLKQRNSDPSHGGLIADSNPQPAYISTTDIRRSRHEKLVSRTMPPIPTTNPISHDERAHAQTLPSLPTYTRKYPTTNLERRSSGPEILSFVSDVKTFPSQPVSHVLSNKPIQMSVSKISQTAKIPEGSISRSSSEYGLHPAPETYHITSPQSFLHFEEDFPATSSKPPSLTSPTGGAVHKPHSSVLSQVRRGLGSVGRRLQGRTRSISEEQLTSLDSFEHVVGELSATPNPPKKHKWLPSKKTAWVPNFSKTPKKEPAQSSPSAPEFQSHSIILHVPELTHHAIDLTEPRAAPSHSGSICSTNGAAAAYALLTGPLPSTATGLNHSIRSTNGGGGLVPSENMSDALMKILEPLNWNTTRLRLTTSAASQTGRDSSQSSHSLPITGGGLANSFEANPNTATTSDANQVVLMDYSAAPVARGNVAMALTNLYRIWESQSVVLNAQQQKLNQILEELPAIRRELQETTAHLDTDLNSIRRDAKTEHEVSSQKLSVANRRLDNLDRLLEEYRVSDQKILIDLRQSFHQTFQMLDYRLSSTTRDLNDGIATLSNKLSIIEKPSDQQSALTHGRFRGKILHTLTDLCVSVFALITMVLHMIIRFLNLGAPLAESRALVVGLLLLFCSIALVYISEPLMVTLHGAPISNYSSIPPTGVLWRDITIRLLSLFRRIGRSSS